MAELPERLREAAHAHRPDRARILARVERAMAASGGAPPARGHAQVGPDPGSAPGDQPPPAPPTAPSTGHLDAARLPPALRPDATDEPAPRLPARPGSGAPEPARAAGPGREPVRPGPARRERDAGGTGTKGTGAGGTATGAAGDGDARTVGGDARGTGTDAIGAGAPADRPALAEFPDAPGPATVHTLTTPRAPGTPHAPALPDGKGTWEGTPAPWVRVAAVAAAVAGAVGLGGLAVGAASHDHNARPPAVSPAHSAPAATPPPRDTGSAGLSRGESRTPDMPHTGVTGPTRPDARAGGRPAAHTPAAPTTAAAPPKGTGSTNATPTVRSSPQGGISARAGVNAGSGTSWTQEDITLTTDRPLTALTVELRVALTPGVTSTGQYASAPALTCASTSVDGNALVYRWTLAQGRTLDSGTYTFAGQFGHADGGRDTSGDRFTVSAAGPNGSVSSGGGY